MVVNDKLNIGERLESNDRGHYFIYNFDGTLSINKSNESNDLDKYIDSLVREYGGLPSYKGYCGYQFSSTISINNEVENGLPNKDKCRKRIL